MDLTWTYSNQQDLADLLRRARVWLSEDRRVLVQNREASVRARPMSATPRRVVDRLGEGVVREVIEARQAGMKLKDVAKRYGISESSVKRLIQTETAGSRPPQRQRILSPSPPKRG